MKYLVNNETKEHKIATPSDISAIRAMKDFSEFGYGWRLVEADDEGWIPWSGGECPLPESKLAEVRLQDGQQGRFESIDLLTHRSWQKWNCGGDIIAYRPILKTAERVENYTEGLPHSAFWKTEPSVFDRLKSAIAASESIPGIIAEIDALLPEGYCVTKREVQPAEDMSDWRNWREGDLVSHKEGGTFKIVNIENPGYVGQYGVRIVDSNKETHWIYHRHLSFHSRPAKVAK